MKVQKSENYEAIVSVMPQTSTINIGVPLTHVHH